MIDRALACEDLREDEVLWLLTEAPLHRVAAAADEVRRREVADPQVVTWQIDRNVNITNVCVSGCKFCNFHCAAGSKKAYVLALEEYVPLVEQTLALGGDQLLLQGGLHPALGIGFYEELFSGLKRLFSQLRLHALGAPEVAHIARLSSISVRETLERLLAAGLDSLPGAGAEILVESVRRRISPAKPTAAEWLDVMREAHRMNIPTSATMMYGHVETPRDIAEHLLKIRDLQASRPAGTYGFVAFIPWIFRSAGTALEREMLANPDQFPSLLRRGGRGADGVVAPLNYLRIIAVSRLVLNNIANIQASWLTVGVETAQMALHSGANDMGSIMIEERVVSSAGARNRLDSEGIQTAIRTAGFTPRLRDQLYRLRGEE